jgi:tetratricopeptide (TPR) repeat protein
MRRPWMLWTIALAHLLAVSAAAGTIRLSGTVYRGNEVDEALTDLLLVELSQQPQVEVLERRQLQMVLGELSLTALVDDAWRQTRLGRLLGVDAFVWIRLRDDQAVLEVAEAATGRGIAARQEQVQRDDLVKTLKSLAREAVRAAREGPAVVDRNAPTLAIAKPVFAQPNQPLRQAVESALIALEQDLKQAGVTMLSRRFLEDLVLERWMMDKGLTSAQRRQLPMLGARYVLTLRVSKGAAQPDVSLLETQTGRRVGYRTWAAAEMRTDAGRAAMAKWIRRRIDPASQQRSGPPGPIPANHDAPLQPETLAPFYHGVLLHNQGRYLDAAEQFREAMRRDQRFLEPYRWMQSCLVGAGFDEVSQAVGDYVDRARQDVWHGISSPKALRAEAGVALIGLSTAPTVSPSLGIPTTMLLIDAVHEATGVTVFVTADMAQLRDEFDALAGLENVAGTTWQQAPPMLFADTLTGHLEPRVGGLRLRLCVAYLLDPGRIAAVTIDLPEDAQQWQKEITAASRRLLDQAAASRPAWSRPPLLLSENDIPAAKLSFKEYTPLGYLKCVARDKEFVDDLRYPYNNDWFENVIMPGLHRWFVRTLPEQSKVRPVVEFAYVSYYGGSADWPTAMEELGRKYPQDPVGMIGRLNALLYRLDLDEDNLRQAQAKLEKLLAELESHVSTTFSRTDLERYRDTNRLMRRALGMPDEGGTLRPGGRAYAHLEYGSPITIRAGGTFPATLDFPGPQAGMQQRAVVDLAVLRCACRKEPDIPVATVKELFGRFADQPDVLAYFSVSYANKIFSNRIQAPTEEELRTLTELYPTHARAVVALLSLEALPYSRQEVGLLVGVHPWLKDFGAKHPAFRHARQQVKKAVLDAITAGRFKKLTPLDVLALVVDVSGQGDPEITPYLKTLADRSLAVDPLEDHYWRVYAQWGQHQTPDERMARYLPFYERVRQLHPQPILNEDTAWWYFDFGLVFFRGGRFDLAEEVLSAIADWEQPRALALSVLKANTDYLLALIRQRERNIPEALRLAKRAVDETSDGTVGLITGIGIGGSRRGRGSTSNLKSLATDLIARLRNDPDAPFEYPFDNRWQ